MGTAAIFVAHRRAAGRIPQFVFLLLAIGVEVHIGGECRDWGTQKFSSSWNFVEGGGLEILEMGLI